MTEPIQWDKHASLSCRKCGGNKLSGGAHDSLRVPRPDPPLLPSIIFPLGPPSWGDECRAERALGCGGIFPRGQQAGGRVRKRRREGNARAARNGFGSRVGYTIQTCDPSVSRTAVRWGPRFSSSAPPRSPAPSFDHFPFGPRLGHIVTTNRPCDSRDSISPSFDTYTNVLNDLTAIFRPIAVFMRVLCGFSRRALHSVELSRTRVAKAIRLSEVQETMFPGAKSKRAPSPKPACYVQ